LTKTAKLIQNASSFSFKSLITLMGLYNEITEKADKEAMVKVNARKASLQITDSKSFLLLPYFQFINYVI
jgi:hypothetical protein